MVAACGQTLVNYTSLARQPAQWFRGMCWNRESFCAGHEDTAPHNKRVIWSMTTFVYIICQQDTSATVIIEKTVMWCVCQFVSAPLPPSRSPMSLILSLSLSFYLYSSHTWKVCIHSLHYLNRLTLCLQHYHSFYNISYIHHDNVIVYLFFFSFTKLIEKKRKSGAYAKNLLSRELSHSFVTRQHLSFSVTDVNFCLETLGRLERLAYRYIPRVITGIFLLTSRRQEVKRLSKNGVVLCLVDKSKLRIKQSIDKNSVDKTH